MAMPADITPMTLVASAASGREPGPAERVPVAFLGRTSTLEMQDPVASLRLADPLLPHLAACGLVHRRLLLGRRIRRPGPGGPRPGAGLAGLHRRRDPPRRRHGRPAHRIRQGSPEIRRRHLRGHRTVRPRHLQRAEAGKETVPQRDPLVRDRRAGRHRRRECHHRAGAADEARRGGMVPAPAEGENLERPCRACPGRVEHRPGSLRVPRGPAAAPGAGQGQSGPHQDPARQRPGPRPGRGADLHLAGRGQARHADHRREAEHRPGPLPRPHRERLDHPDCLRRAR